MSHETRYRPEFLKAMRNAKRDPQGFHVEATKWTKLMREIVEDQSAWEKHIVERRRELKLYLFTYRKYESLEGHPLIHLIGTQNKMPRDCTRNEVRLGVKQLLQAYDKDGMGSKPVVRRPSPPSSLPSANTPAPPISAQLQNAIPSTSASKMSLQPSRQEGEIRLNVIQEAIYDPSFAQKERPQRPSMQQDGRSTASPRGLYPNESDEPSKAQPEHEEPAQSLYNKDGAKPSEAPLEDAGDLLDLLWKTYREDRDKPSKVPQTDVKRVPGSLHEEKKAERLELQQPGNVGLPWSLYENADAESSGTQPELQAAGKGKGREAPIGAEAQDLIAQVVKSASNRLLHSHSTLQLVPKDTGKGLITNPGFVVGPSDSRTNEVEKLEVGKNQKGVGSERSFERNEEFQGKAMESAIEPRERPNEEPDLDTVAAFEQCEQKLKEMQASFNTKTVDFLRLISLLYQHVDDIRSTHGTELRNFSLEFSALKQKMFQQKDDEASTGTDKSMVEEGTEQGVAQNARTLGRDKAQTVLGQTPVWYTGIATLAKSAAATQPSSETVPGKKKAKSVLQANQQQSAPANDTSHRPMTLPTPNTIIDAPSQTTTVPVPAPISPLKSLSVSASKIRAVLNGSQNKDATQASSSITRTQVAKSSTTELMASSLSAAAPGPSFSRAPVIQAKKSFPSTSSFVFTPTPLRSVNNAPIEKNLDESICDTSHSDPTLKSQEMTNATDKNESTKLTEVHRPASQARDIRERLEAEKEVTLMHTDTDKSNMPQSQGAFYPESSSISRHLKRKPLTMETDERPPDKRQKT